MEHRRSAGPPAAPGLAEEHDPARVQQQQQQRGLQQPRQRELQEWQRVLHEWQQREWDLQERQAAAAGSARAAAAAAAVGGAGAGAAAAAGAAASGAAAEPAAGVAGAPAGAAGAVAAAAPARRLSLPPPRAGLRAAPPPPGTAAMEPGEPGEPGELVLEAFPKEEEEEAGPCPPGLLAEKEREVRVAARLGRALLRRNQDLGRQSERMHRRLTDQLEHLEQEKHELRRRYENREGEWEGRVSELESDVKQLQDELEKQQIHLREADREKTRAVQELSEQNQRLLDQLSRASEVEQRLSMQVHTLREDFREKNSSSNQHIIRLEGLQAEQVLEIKMLSERKRELEQRLSAAMEENDLLQGTVEELQERVVALERQTQEQDLQLQQSRLELQEVRLSYRQLQGKVDELSEERSLQPFNTTGISLLSEIEQSMEAEELEQEREQLRLQLWEAYCQVRYLCSHLRGNDSADSAVSTDSSMDESSDSSSTKDVPAGSLRAALSELKRLIQSVVDGGEAASSRRIDDDALEDQIRQTSEDSRALRELMEGERGKLRQSLEELQRLHSEVTLLSVEMTALKEEKDRLRGTSEEKEPKEQLLKAIRDRDEAIAKKNAMELELAKCKVDMMALNGQLLDAIQQKLNLSQQLEAWQDDMHRVIDRQLMAKHQKERGRPATASFSGGLRAARGPPAEQRGPGPDGRRLFSFFRKI
ncbi:BICD family-like cargo adapter 1 [Tachyglossus aculeatus]|uniref:BICD family-like cargo adapter 1 n=1 Tax=Tachyglossus aculeatus TaxID=9261 RepID=UPI0018F293E1|nr:BICD family-like cargo adapter 1 [Tachyglossus aculeatus]